MAAWSHECACLLGWEPAPASSAARRVKDENDAMTPPDYDYHGLIASTWDLWRDDTADWSDRHLYLDVIRRYGQPALDIGCGTGRLVLDYASVGIDIDGVDNSPEMLAICRAKAAERDLRPTLYEQDMQALDLPRRYRTIIGSSSVLQLVTDGDAARAVLHRCFAHLEPGGAFVTPFTFDWREGEPLDTGWEPLFTKTRPEDGATVRSWVREWREPARQWWHTQQRFEVEVDGEVVEREEQHRSPEGRWYSQDEVVKLYEDVGFVDIQLLRGFEPTRAAAEDRLFSALGVKPPAPA
jgi:SAM-dependent methyltransferase